MKFTTPLYELFQDEQRNRIFIKRDDLLPDSLGGNKVRIAEAFFRDMEGTARITISGNRPFK